MQIVFRLFYFKKFMYIRKQINIYPTTHEVTSVAYRT